MMGKSIQRLGIVLFLYINAARKYTKRSVASKTPPIRVILVHLGDFHRRYYFKKMIMLVNGFLLQISSQLAFV
jgi:hypothetical protein